jgi:DNA helicase-2/ATP-dependent DNA helicase PcrA
LALSFSKRAANELTDRIHAICSSKSQVVVSTFHSLCHSILQTHGWNIGLKNYKVCLDTKTIINQILVEEEITELNASYFITSVTEAKNRQETAEIYKLKHSKNKEISIVYSKYQQKLKDENMMDFDDLLLYTMILFQNTKIRDQISSKIHYLFIDEFQDTNELQFQICANLFHVHRRVMVVGDPEQTIFSWRFANAKNIQMLMNECPKLHKIYLVQNYRSSVKILEVASKLMKSTRKENRDLISNTFPGDKIIVKYCLTKADELEFVVSEIKKCKKTDFPNIAILTRSKQMMMDFEEALEREGIPSRVLKNSNFLSLPQLVLFFNYLRVVSGTFTLEQAVSILFSPNRRISTTILDFIQRPKLSLSDFCNSLKSYCESCDFEEISPIKEVIHLLTTLHDMNEMNSKISHILMKLYDFIEKSFSEYESTTNLKINRILEVVKLCEKIEPQQRLLPIQSVLNFVDGEIQSASSESSDGVVLSTLHGSKGLEWKIVFLPGLEDGVLPHFLSQENVDEERRLFFVGITRAKERLFVSTCAIRRSGIVSQPSCFLYSICNDSNNVEVIPLNKLERLKLQNPDGIDSETLTSMEEEEEEDFVESTTVSLKRDVESCFDTFTQASRYKKVCLSQEE